MKKANPDIVDAAYDAVGRYQQDEVNGFSQDLIFRMLGAAEPETASAVLDAMAGDGNLTRRLGEYCRERGIAFPETTVLEYSRTQSNFAKQDLATLGAKVLWGDVLGMADLATGLKIPANSFDRVLIKSANHEIPLADQQRLYNSVLQVLRPGGLFVNLGMLFDSVKERDELRELARVKDTFAGMHAAALNRYFLTREELYSFLRAAGFVDVRQAHSLEYSIRSRAVADHYFRPEERERTNLEFQAAQIKAVTLRKNGRLRFEGAESVMSCPGEITVARRPTLAHTNATIFRQYPMDFLRHVRAHAQMLEEAAKYVSKGANLLDAGCGIGLLTEHLSQPGLKYTGLDVSAEFINVCTARYGKRPGFSFQVADLNSAELGTDSYDAVTLLNTVNLPGIQAVDAIRKALQALHAGGRLIVSGPVSRESFNRAEPSIITQLEQDGHKAGHEPEIPALREANARLLTAQGNYWSLEGMVALLKHLGFGRIVAVNNELYFGLAYMVVAEK